MSAVVDFPVKPEARPYLEAFGHQRHGSDPNWLVGYRHRNLARFALALLGGQESIAEIGDGEASSFAVPASHGFGRIKIPGRACNSRNNRPFSACERMTFSRFGSILRR